VELIKDDIDFNAYATEPESHKIRSASEFVQETIDAFYLPADAKKSPRALWEKMRGKIEFRPGEVSLWAGINGHGKSMFLSQVTLDLILQSQKVLVLSFEMKPFKQMQRMCRQARATAEPPIQFIKDFHTWTDGKLWMYDHNGSIKWQQVMAVMRYAVEKYGIAHFVIDSMMKCVKGDDDYNAQKDFVDELCAFAQARQIHVHLVHHVRKGQGHEEAMPGKWDVKGGGAITDQVDNLFFVWRDKKAERGDDANKPTALLKCDKQRHGEWEGMLGFWYEPESMQYLEKPGATPMQYEMRSRCFI